MSTDKIDIVKETAEKLGVDPIPSVMTAYLGGTPEQITRIMGTQLNVKLTKESEANNPLNEETPDYTEIERIIADMLTENTGAHFLDSGGAYGRNWERNRKVDDFRDNPPVAVEIWGTIGESIEYPMLGVDIFHYLTEYLETDETSESYQKMLDKIYQETDLGYYGAAEELADQLIELEKVDSKTSFNSYNSESCLSQVIQGIWLFDPSSSGFYGDNYLILQIHNGADVRGGYTAPKVFFVPESEYMVGSDADFWADCDCMNIYTDHYGYHWYLNEDKREQPQTTIDGRITELLETDRLPKRWKIADTDPKTLKCDICDKTAQFSHSLGAAKYV